jgi:hypothetical protein
MYLYMYLLVVIQLNPVVGLPVDVSVKLLRENKNKLCKAG